MRTLMVVLLALFLLSCPALASSLRHVERIVDGDTIVLDGGETVRLLDIDTPETVHPNKPVQAGGLEAARYLKQRLEGKYIRLKYGHERFDKYGRTLAYVYLGNKNINTELVEKGFATPYEFSNPPKTCNSLDGVLIARSGCCSWHGGVCGCSGNSALCCDGTLSPSCGCWE